MTSQQDYRASFSRKLGVVSALVLVVFTVVVIGQALITKDAAIQRGKLIAERLAKIQSDHVELTFKAVDLTLRGVSESQYYNSLFGQKITDEIEHDLQKWVADTPQVAWILLADADGKTPIISSKIEYKKWAGALTSIAKEEFFEFHKNNVRGTDRLSISVSKINPQVNENMIILSRSIYNFDGSFGGVIAAAVDSRYFFQFFKSIEIGDKILMALSIDNGKVIVSRKEDWPREIISLKPSAEVKTQLHEIGDKKYISSYRSLHNLPVMVTLAFDEQDILATWRSDRLTDLVFLILFTVFGGILFTLIMAMAKQIQRAEASEKQAMLANQAKSEFLAKMSHELRTPLNAIIGFSEMIDSGYFGPLNNSKQQERIHDINLCGTHLLQLINDILDYSKGEAGKLEIHDSEIAIHRIVDEAERMLKDKAKSKNITLLNNISPEFARLLADERKIKQIIINLLSNALKFTNKGGEVSVSAEKLRNGDIKVSVADNGIGMNPEDIPKALSVFGQIRTQKEPEDEGTGLGLPLCKMLAELHGGELEIETELNVGTTVSLILPAERVVTKEA